MYTLNLGDMMAMPNCWFSYWKTNILAISSSIATWSYTWRQCENGGFTLGNKHCGIVIMSSLRLGDMMAVPNCWFSYKKTTVLAKSWNIASWWQTWRYCQNVGFTIGKPTIWHGHHVSHGYRIGAWGRNRLLFRGLGLKSVFLLGLQLDITKTLLFI